MGLLDGEPSNFSVGCFLSCISLLGDKQALQFLMDVCNVCTRYSNGGGR